MYLVDKNILIFGDENCVGEPDRTTHLGPNFWIVHNHPLGSPPFLSVADGCFANYHSARRMDVAGFMPIDEHHAVRVVMEFRQRNARKRWPCDDDADMNSMMPNDGNIEVKQYIADEYPLYFDTGRRRIELAKMDREFQREEAERIREDEVERERRKTARFNDLEIDGARRPRKRVKAARRASR